MKKKLIYILCAVLMFLSAAAKDCMDVSATGKNDKKVCRAYAKAIENGKIKISKRGDGSLVDFDYILSDINGDGTKDLILMDENWMMYGWTYKKGKVRVLFKKHNVDLTDSIYCDGVNNSYWIPGEGGGYWYQGFKIKKKKLVPTVQYYIEWESDNKYYATKTVNRKTSNISVAKYKKIEKSIQKKKHVIFKGITKRKLIAKLRKMGK